MQEKEQGITVGKDKDFSDWYNQVVLKAELADYSPVRGFMVIRPNAFKLWENIQGYFNKVTEKRKVSNAYFPLLIPESFFKREAEHAEGFAPELAWIDTGDKDTDERVAIRPTSETIIYDSYSKWIRSWRDLPLRINQWCNVLRWEVKQTKLFLRTREFLWQEGHCVYEDKEQCDKEVRLFLDEYQKMCKELLAIPTLAGKKTDAEKFAGAFYTLTLEALMPDGKALQMGTSHNLGQDFAKVFGINFLDKNEKEALPWQSSWGFSTRLIGALIMVHGDDKGLVLPPKMAFNKAVIVPILFKKDKDDVLKKAKELQKELSSFNAILDDRDSYSPGWKFNEWELKGIPIRLEIGPRDLKAKQVILVRRDNGEKETVKFSALKKKVTEVLDDIQNSLYAKAEKFLKSNTVTTKDWSEFKKGVKKGKMVLTPFCEKEGCEENIKEETTATSRCIPFDQKPFKGKCVKCGSPTENLVYFAKAY
ncbi:MAG: proline--tRNA ligase [Candidatus Diapherotrites archaeon]|uniref:Proline--tRNA ligase n=1 Tax=Candidatus Iainarchaeum sp. TaxID=3101447 RepID=A0A2D6M1R6_9ARCH|nr:proline--tRNA ligase [Candidatus Diapherotrites archaeon]